MGTIPKLKKLPIPPTIPEEQVPATDGAPQQEEQQLLPQQPQPTAMEEDGTEATAAPAPSLHRSAAIPASIRSPSYGDVAGRKKNWLIHAYRARDNLVLF